MVKIKTSSETVQIHIPTPVNVTTVIGEAMSVTVTATIHDKTLKCFVVESFTHIAPNTGEGVQVVDLEVGEHTDRFVNAFIDAMLEVMNVVEELQNA